MTPRSGGTRGKADMHLHALLGRDRRRRGIAPAHRDADQHDLVAITDHERLDGALRAREIHAGGYRFEVVGEEITTRAHHAGPVRRGAHPALRPLPETLERIHEQGGLAIAAHPRAAGDAPASAAAAFSRCSSIPIRVTTWMPSSSSTPVPGRPAAWSVSASTSMSCSWQPWATRMRMCSSMWHRLDRFPGTTAAEYRQPSWSAPASRPASTGAGWHNVSVYGRQLVAKARHLRHTLRPTGEWR